MDIETFEMERLQSTWENTVDCDLSESGTRAVTLHELTEMGFDLGPLLRMPLGYSQTNGTTALRERLATQYPGATPDHIMVTTGCAEANYLVLAALLEKGDGFALEVPNFLQVRGLARFWTQRPVESFHLRFDSNWEPDWDEFERAVRPGTKLVYITNPNNPTGTVLSDAARTRIVSRCEQVGAWLICDEVYLGSELEAPVTETLYGMSDRIIVVSGLSKAYGIPGVRIGWLVGPKALAAETWRLHDYTTIGPSKLSDAIACFAVRDDVRRKLFERSRAIVNAQLPLVQEFVASTGGMLEFNPPKATAMAFMRWTGNENSGALCRRLLDRRSVLVVNGNMLGCDGFIRLWTGAPRDRLVEGLARTAAEISETV